MATYQEAAEKRRALSAQVSAIARSLSFGVLAVAWLFLAGGEDVPAIVAYLPEGTMLVIAALAVFAIALDLIQYVAAYLQLAWDVENAQKAGASSVKYKQSTVRLWAFWGKTCIAVLASLLLVAVLLLAALSTP